MKAWNSSAFKSAIKNIKAAVMQGYDKFEDKGYDLKKEAEICLFLADVILKQSVEGTTVHEWTKKRSSGPREEWQVKKLEKFLGILLLKEEGEKEMKEANTYSNFVKEKIFTVHEAIMDYLDERGEEEMFWKMQNVIDRCKVAIPEHVYDVIQGFVDQYLEEDLFGAIYSKKEHSTYDLSKYASIDAKCPNPEVGEDHVMWFKLMTMYDLIATEHIRPYLV